MNKIMRALAAVAALGIASAAQAFPTAPYPNYTGIFYENAEVWVPGEGNQSAGGATPTIMQGDQFWGVLNAQNIRNSPSISGQLGPNIWLQGGSIAPPVEFTGYFAVEVTQVIAAGTIGNPTDIIVYGNTTDPNGILAAGSFLNLYEGNVLNYDITTQGSALATSTDGTLTAELALAYYYSLTPAAIPAVGGSAVGEGYTGADFLTGYTSADFLDDPNEVFANILVQLFSNNEILRNSDATGAATPLVLGDDEAMHFLSNDPAVMRIPEPGTLALLGGSLLGFAALRRRIRKS
jgi:hypothetical protein